MKAYREQIADRCRYFRGIFHHDTCEAGVRYDTVKDPDARPIKLPCFRSKGIRTCPSASFLTDAELDAEIAAHDAHMNGLAKAMRAAHADAKAQGFGRGKAGRGEVPCPTCNDGILYYSVAALNGHLWGKCATEGCVAWME